MTQHSGFYCLLCRTRYVYHACKDGLPCEHDKRDAFYTFRWDCTGGYQKFMVANERFGVLFNVHSVTQEQLDEAIAEYSKWLEYCVKHDLTATLDDPVKLFKAACESAGGQGATSPPVWRQQQLYLKKALTP